MNSSRFAARVPDLRWVSTLAAMVMASVCVAVYLPALSGPFLLDDFTVIPQLAAAREAGLTVWDTLQTAPAHVRARVLANLSFIASHEMAGGGSQSALAYKAGNLALHLLAGLLVARLHWVLDGMTGGDPRRRRLAVTLSGAVFLLHPLLLSTVAYPVQRMAQLSTVFVLLSVLAYLSWRRHVSDQNGAPGVGRWIRLALVPICMALAFAAKENGLLAPLLIGSVELFALRWPARNSPNRSEFEQGFGLCVAAPLVLGAVLLAWRWPALAAFYGERDFGLAERLLTQVHVLWQYIGHWAWPRIAEMGLYRDDIAIIHKADPLTVSMALGLAVALVIAFLTRRRAPMRALGIAWFFAAHALESTIIPLELYFEHRNYLAAFGPVMVAGWLVAQWARPVAVAIGAAVCALLAFQTHQRASDWSSFERLIRSEYTHHPRSLRAGVELVLELERRPAGAEEAGRVVRELRTAYPSHFQPALLQRLLDCRQVSAEQPSPSWWRESTVNKDSFHLFDELRSRMTSGRCPRLDPSEVAAIALAVSQSAALAGRPAARAAWLRQHAALRIQSGECPAAESALSEAWDLTGDDPRDGLTIMQCAVSRGDRERYLEWRGIVLSRFSRPLPQIQAEVAHLDRQWATDAAPPQRQQDEDGPGR